MQVAELGGWGTSPTCPEVDILLFKHKQGNMKVALSDLTWGQWLSATTRII